jgi:hypothetical protein
VPPLYKAMGEKREKLTLTIEHFENLPYKQRSHTKKNLLPQ